MSEALMTINLEPNCMTSLMRIMSAARNGEVWALKFFEAQPRPPSGMVEMSVAIFGNYDECVNIESPDEEDKPKIYGQYCGMNIRDNMDISPHSVPREYLENIGQKLPQNTAFNYKNYFNQFFGNYRKVIYRMTPNDLAEGIELIDNQLYDNIRLMNGLCLPTTCKASDVSAALTEFSYPITRLPIILDDDCDYLEKPIKLNKYQIVSVY
ncbi:unnamed protein product [Oppiella nova]|uniref:Nose resistant-to-fluoxetine protein N-terminal domain-containing protein n=1 Tax=Oppiella nova TaxID=334625 RepID=A0A7R9MJF5_9ACAR|nr:unnamed protein product [Oppiella nova]CAG2178416.1 unnamed protein product [Oppiella nova]